jgi:LPXTG-motif cell wall-anchored protein
MKVKLLYKKVYIFLIILILIMAIPPILWGHITYASSLELVGIDLGLKVTPEDTKLFNISNMNPGQTVSSKITVSNTYKSPFELFLRTERASTVPLPGEPDLFKQIKLTITFRGKVIFNGSMFNFASSKGGLSLGIFKPSEIQELTATVYLPGAETGNEFQGLRLDTKWIFTATSKDAGELPKTGSDINSYLYSLLGLLLIGAGSVGIYKFRGPKND